MRTTDQEPGAAEIASAHAPPGRQHHVHSANVSPGLTPSGNMANLVPGDPFLLQIQRTAELDVMTSWVTKPSVWPTLGRPCMEGSESVGSWGGHLSQIQVLPGRRQSFNSFRVQLTVLSSLFYKETAGCWCRCLGDPFPLQEGAGKWLPSVLSLHRRIGEPYLLRLHVF